MAEFRFRLTTGLVLIVALIFRCAIDPVSANAELTPSPRLLRDLVQFDATQTVAHTLSNSPSASSSSAEATVHPAASAEASAISNHTTDNAASAESSAESKHELPSIMSFIGPAAAGVLAIVLIGAVIAFKYRSSK